MVQTEDDKTNLSQVLDNDSETKAQFQPKESPTLYHDKFDKKI